MRDAGTHLKPDGGVVGGVGADAHDVPLDGVLVVVYLALRAAHDGEGVLWDHVVGQ